MRRKLFGAGRVRFVGCWLLILSCVSVEAAQPSGRGGPQDAAKMEKLVKLRFQEMMRVMTETARRLESTDKKTSDALVAAVNKAESALIADRMDKVVEMLDSGLLVAADSVQGEVILHMREVLKAIKGEEGMEWRVFLIEELKRQMQDLALVVERQRTLERLSRMLAFGDDVKSRIADLRTRAETLTHRQEAVLELTRNMRASPASIEFGGIRQGISAIVQRLDVSRDVYFNRLPSADELARNMVAVRGFFAQATTLRTSVRTLLNREDVKKAMAAAADPGALNALAVGDRLVKSVSDAADELERCRASMSTNNVEEGLVALMQAKALLQDARSSLDAIAEGFSDVKPAVQIVTDQKTIDDSISQLTPVLMQYFQAGTVAMDDTPDGDERVKDNTNRLAERIKTWERQVPLVVALDPLGATARQEQALEKLKDWVERLKNVALDVDRLKQDPRYPVQKTDQDGIERDLRGMLKANESRAATMGDDAQLSQVFSEMDTLYANAADYSAKASGHLGLEQPREANTNQNDVIHLLMRVINQVHSELRLSQIESAMNEQAQARIQRMILRQKMCLVETKSVWDGRGGDGVYSRSARMRIEEIAKEQKGIQADADVVWEIINTAHAVGYNCFPAEARLMMEMARLEMQMAEKRLTAVDPGEETQRIEESIIARLKKTESMCAMEIPGGAKETDVKFTFGVMLTRPPINSFQRAPILAMLLAIQEDIATRTQRVSASRRAGNTDPGLDAEMEQLRQLQENVLAQLNQYAREDARAFGGPDSMATQYGTVTGGTKATYVGRGGH